MFGYTYIQGLRYIIKSHSEARAGETKVGLGMYEYVYKELEFCPVNCQSRLKYYIIYSLYILFGIQRLHSTVTVTVKVNSTT